MKVKIGECVLEVIEFGTAYYKNSPHRQYQAYKVVDDEYGVSYAVKEQAEFGRYEKGWFHRRLTDVSFIPTFNPRLIGV